ncbi:hypothetical protein J3458_000276 [Metarhizium acridum]|uniref:uncharacterized protein n=1 Tax=Metarhizium acridum TaxID=92637 RepID=UPI001C6BB1BF|nr:hypothetical protein J3458_000276 [Metarhizium acridum]
MLSLLLCVGLANAAVVRNSGCDFHMSAAGSHGGPLGELNGDQIPFGNIPQTTFHIDGDKIWDSNGHGCWWTPPTRVLQCDTNQPPDSGFKVGCDGKVSYHGKTTFYQCETGDDDQYNIYLGPNNGINCGEVTLAADGCHARCPPPPQPVKSCPANLNGSYEFPHLIIPVDVARHPKHDLEQPAWKEDRVRHYYCRSGKQLHNRFVPLPSWSGYRSRNERLR